MPPADASQIISARPAIDDLRTRMQMVISHNPELFDKATAYDNAIMIGGYAAFFTVWSGASPHMLRWEVLWSAGLILVSLTLYVVWHIYQMYTRQCGQRRFAKVAQANHAPAIFLEKWQEADAVYKRDLMILLGRWPFVFIPSVVTGLGASAVLGYAVLHGLFVGAPKSAEILLKAVG